MNHSEEIVLVILAIGTVAAIAIHEARFFGGARGLLSPRGRPIRKSMRRLRRELRKTRSLHRKLLKPQRREVARTEAEHASKVARAQDAVNKLREPRGKRLATLGRVALYEWAVCINSTFYDLYGTRLHTKFIGTGTAFTFTHSNQMEQVVAFNTERRPVRDDSGKPERDANGTIKYVRDYDPATVEHFASMIRNQIRLRHEFEQVRPGLLREAESEHRRMQTDTKAVVSARALLQHAEDNSPHKDAITRLAGELVKQRALLTTAPASGARELNR